MAKSKTRLSPTQKAELDTIVKRANERLRELERKGFTKQRAYSRVEFWQNKNVNFLSTTKNGEVKFRTDIARLYKENPQAVYDLKRYANEFLEYETSKAGAIEKQYSQAQETFKKKYGFELTGDEAKEVFESSLYQEVLQSYGSDEIIELAKMSPDESADKIYDVLKQLKAGKTQQTITREYWEMSTREF